MKGKVGFTTPKTNHRGRGWQSSRNQNQRPVRQPSTKTFKACDVCKTYGANMRVRWDRHVCHQAKCREVRHEFD